MALYVKPNLTSGCCGVALRAEIEGFSAGIVEGWGEEEPGFEKVTGDFILPEREKIKKCGVDLSLEPISFESAEQFGLELIAERLVAGFKNQAV